ncbi:MAG: YgiT-type zinc finger protein [Deltaproteobacteria bacterium]|nr:YgiT-type zinc finger protein [Deltaproteobacteria bacterium]
MRHTTPPTPKITSCPTCGSTKIRRVRKTVKRTHAGQTYVVPDLAFWECAACGERIYDRTAMRQIEAHSPAYHKTRRAAAR